MESERKLYPEISNDYTLKDSIDIFMNSDEFANLSPSTRSLYKLDLARFVESSAKTKRVKLNNLSADLIKNHLKMIKSESVRRRSLSAIRNFADWANEQGVLNLVGFSIAQKYYRGIRITSPKPRNRNF